MLHTNGESLSGPGLGTLSRLGHVDFYPNCGMSQPSCLMNLDLACSHSRAHEYFTASIHAATMHVYPSGTGP